MSSSSSSSDSDISEDDGGDEEEIEEEEVEAEEIKEENDDCAWEPLPVDVDGAMIDVGGFIGHRQALDCPVFSPPAQSDSEFDARSVRVQVDTFKATELHEDLILQ